MIAHILISSFKTFESAKNTESTERQEASFPKKNVKNADPHKLVLNKLIKYSFVASLTLAKALTRFPTGSKNSGKKFKYLENEKSF